MADDAHMSVDVAVDSLPLVVPRALGALRIVLLRQSNSEDSWDLDYATVGTETRHLWVEAEDDLGNEYTAETAWSSSDEHLVHGTYTFTPPLAELDRSLTLTFSLEHTDERVSSGHERLTPEHVRHDWVEILQSQLAGWVRREEVIDAVLGASTREDAIQRLTSPPLGFAETAAGFVLDLPLGRLTQDAGRELAEHLERARDDVEG